MGSDPAAQRRSAFVRRNVIDSGTGTAWGIAVETPVEIGINHLPWTVMLATPADLEDLAVGLAFTERLIDDASAIEDIVVSQYLEGIAVDLVVPRRHVNESARRSRLLEGRTGCGLCGVESMAALRQPVESRTTISAPRVTIAPAAIAAAFTALSTFQPLNRETRSAHAAAWCHPDGQVALAREDVGRHNALDKLVGALLRENRFGDPGFIVMTSRCSFELVYKALAAGASMLATLSAPTSLALDWAESLGLPLACCGPSGEIVRFAVETAHAG
jgi:FdhD protein